MIHLVLLTVSVLSTFTTILAHYPLDAIHEYPHVEYTRMLRGGGGWSYGSGVEKWTRDYPNCAGTRQSPIALLEVTAIKIPLFLLRWGNMKKRPRSMTLTNNGHTVQLTGSWADGETPYIEFTKSRHRFILQQVHWHWGHGADDGTEHKVEGNTGALEMHMVFRKISGRGRAQNLVYGQTFLYDNGALSTPPGIITVANNLRAIKKNGQVVKLRRVFRAADLIPSQPMRLFFYIGSLTTPPCSQPVLWLVAQKSGFVRDHEMNAFRSVKDSHGGKMAGNVRPLQLHNGRSIKLFT